jgi:hypothetical protein
MIHDSQYTTSVSYVSSRVLKFLYSESYTWGVTTGWTFLTNHAHVFLCLAADPKMRLRDVAAKVGITERAAQRIAADLGAEGYISTKRIGRRNQYAVHPELPLRHPVEGHRPAAVLLQILGERQKSARSRGGEGAPDRLPPKRT